MNFKKILLAVDSSENALRAVEYTGNIVGGNPGFEVQLLCIERLPHRDLYADDDKWEMGCEEMRANLQDFLGRARDRLAELGVDPKAITENYVTSCHSPFTDSTSKCSLGTSVALEILDTLKAGGFGTVVIGRRGLSKAEEFLFGSVSNKIVHSAKDCTVWVVA
ncbi:universal stress protein [Salidesulfovibrio onnuriiensis]|uniref:universal stress protein n=1 Tax=Salidesulfovibrio onnuriiensis TaxID=2583823 RepID=UPI0011C97D4B|nr:universal stress protein [Salidesulfovibrio onnuriiensis]